MAARDVTFADLGRDPAEVARGLLAWERGDRAEAVALTLAAVARELHARSHPLWVWTGEGDGGDVVWVLPVTVHQAARFAPRGPVAVLVDAIAAGVDAGAIPEGIRLLDWQGWAALEMPGADGELSALALAERHPHASGVRTPALPAEVLGAPPEVPLEPLAASGPGLAGLAHRVGAHPVEVALTLAEHGQPLGLPDYPDEMADNLRTWGLSAAPAEPAVPGGPPTIAEDPCHRRRHARRVLQRLLRMGKVGTGYHTAVDHLYRGAPADQRHEAMEVGEALIRAGLLGEKPSVGQRHVYLRRDALPRIHALIERAETDDAGLEALWTAPPPGDGAAG
jgi:hypothetical protein